MTVAVGVIEPGGIYLAADTMVTRGETTEYDATKVFVYGEYGLGFAISGYLHGAQILGDAIHATMDPVTGDQLAARPTTLSMRELMHNLRLQLVASGWDPDCENGQPPSWDQAYLITDGASLWAIECHMSARRRRDYDAIGAGMEVALGALHVTRAGGGELFSAEDAAIFAVEACNQHSRYCGGSAKIRYIEKPETEVLVP